jgi:hypothetical protein
MSRGKRFHSKCCQNLKDLVYGLPVGRVFSFYLEKNEEKISIILGNESLSYTKTIHNHT